MVQTSLQRQTDGMFDKSILIIAHPDDEVLFFSSILDRVDEILFCYMDCTSHVEWGVGRKKSLNEYPLKNISRLDLNESETFYGVDWEYPMATEYGLYISNKEISDIRYRQNYSLLIEALGTKLQHYRNVFTHNPWGEYGHCEHVQIFRVIKQLQKTLFFNLWYSNYCSNKSFSLMVRYVSGFQSDYVSLSTNRHLGEQIKDLYKKNHCWTWYDDWVWFQEESFIRDQDLAPNGKDYGHIFPLNMVKVETNYLSKEKRKSFSVRALLTSIFNRQQVEREKDHSFRVKKLTARPGHKVLS